VVVVPEPKQEEKKVEARESESIIRVEEVPASGPS
jgi:hypothetical protein